MAHYTLLENNIVYQVIVGSDENHIINGDFPEKTYTSLYNCKVLRTSYNTKGGIHYQEDNTPSEDQTKAFRKNYAGIGYYYDEQRDAFIPPKPYSSWVLNEFSCLWEAPIPRPTGTNLYTWNEETQSWDTMS